MTATREKREQERVRVARPLRVLNGQYSGSEFRRDFTLLRMLSSGMHKFLAKTGRSYVVDRTAERPWWRFPDEHDLVWLRAAAVTHETLRRWWSRRDSHRAEVEGELAREFERFLKRVPPVAKLKLYVEKPDTQQAFPYYAPALSEAMIKKLTIIDFPDYQLKGWAVAHGYLGDEKFSEEAWFQLLTRQAVDKSIRRDAKGNRLYEAVFGMWDTLWVVDDDPLLHAKTLALRLYYLLAAAQAHIGQCTERSCGRWFLNLSGRRTLCSDECIRRAANRSLRDRQKELTYERRRKEHRLKLDIAQKWIEAFERLRRPPKDDWKRWVAKRASRELQGFLGKRPSGRITPKFLTQALNKHNLKKTGSFP